MKNLRLIAALLSLGAALMTQAAEYTIVDLGPGQANAINSNGQIVGASLSNVDGTNYWEATAWVTNYPAYQRIGLGWLNGAFSCTTNFSISVNGPHSYAYAINDNGYITGKSLCELQTPATSQHGYYEHGTRAFLTDISGTNAMQRIAPVFDENYYLVGIAGHGINNSNTVAGVSACEGSRRAFLQEFPSEDLTIIGTFNGNFHYWAQAINNAGVWAGQVDDDVSEYWTAPTAYAGGQMLGNLFETNTFETQSIYVSGANAINNSNRVAGYSSYDENEGLVVACVWTNLTPQSIVNLGTISTNDNWSVAFGINDAGIVVGSSGANQGYQALSRAAFVYDTTNGMRDLNTLIPSESGWTLEYATAINASGWIVGYGTKVIDPCTMETEEHAFLLIPNP